jgi:glycosyltransferase involved in cell wall biosynthesis
MDDKITGNPSSGRALFVVPDTAPRTEAADRSAPAPFARAGTRHPSQKVVDVSVVMPCLNEAESIAECIRKARRSLDELGLVGEIIVADNGSTDGSQEIASRLGARVVHVEAKGYGSALLGGFAAARGTYVVMGDADGSYDFGHLGPFIEKLREGNDVVIGNRFQGGIQPGAMPALNRYVGNPILSRLGRRFFGSQIGDFHCGIRAFRRESLVRLDLGTTGMEFASEMVVKASLANLRVAEVPTTLHPAQRSRAPHLRRWRDGWRHLRFLLLYSPRWLFLYPGLFLMVVGLAGLAWLLPHPRKVGDVGFDVQTLLFAAVGVVVGFQAVLFWFLTKVYAANVGLLPEDPLITQLQGRVTLEMGLIVGGGLLLAGLAGSVFAIVHWSSESFGRLNVSSSLRVVIPSAVLLIIGFETALSSFFFSVLGLKRR